MNPIYHVTTAGDWQKALEQGFYEAPSLRDEGFIHCSEEAQVAAILERFYKGKPGVIKLVIDPAKIKAPLIYEWSASLQQNFPHIYGAINLDAVQEAVAL